MSPQPRFLLNTAQIEIWPAALLRARGNADARRLAQARQVLRRKRDGQYLATIDAAFVLRPLRRQYADAPGLRCALTALRWIRPQRRPSFDAVPELPLGQLHTRLQRLGLDVADYARHSGLAPVAEPAWLLLAGRDRYRRPLWLQPAAARAWADMRANALRAGILLEAVSGYRSHDYQLSIFERKRARGQSIDDILKVNAAPGFSEHHSGFALDISAAGEPPTEACFERTPAFAWLSKHAGRHGFRMSYPRENRHGIVYEPWHWRYHPPR